MRWAWILALLVLASCAPGTQEGAGLVFFNARLMTRDPERPEATAIAIQGDRIVAVGDDEDIRGSDLPVDRDEPLFGIHSAVTRQDRRGLPPGGWHPQERLTLDEAIRAYTEDAAYAAFEDDRKGRIAPGFWADLTVLDKDLREISPNEILRSRSPTSSWEGGSCSRIRSKRLQRGLRETILRSGS